VPFRGNIGKSEAAAFKVVNINNIEKNDVHAQLDYIFMLMKLLLRVERPTLIQADNKRARIKHTKKNRELWISGVY